MIKKSGAKKTSGKAPKKTLKKKAVDTPISPEKSAGKKTASRKVTSKTKRKKTPSVKKTGRVQAQKEKVQKPKKTTVKQETVPTKAVSRKAIKKTTVTPSRKTLKKPAAQPRKAKKHLITSKSVPAAKRGREEKPKKVKDTPGKAAGKSKKQIATKKTAQVKTSAQLKTPLKKGVAARPKKKVTEKAQEPEKIEPIKAPSRKHPGEKLKTKISEERKQIKKAEVLREAKKEKKFKEVQELPAIKTDTIAAEYPPAELFFPPTPMVILPSEYGENSITLMTVNPYKLFVFWEVRKETLQTFKGVLNLRVYDVTGIDLDTSEAHSSQDSVVGERVGKMYLDAGPAREYIADIGIVYNGIFISIARSLRVFTPGAGVPGEEEFLPEGLDIGPRIGY